MSNSVQHHTIDIGSVGQRLDNFLVKILKGVPKSHIYRLVRKGEVRVNRKRVKVDYRLCEGDQVRLPPIRQSPTAATALPTERVLQQLQQATIFEDGHFLVLNKPSGIAVHGGSGLSYGVIEGLRALRPEAPYLELAHRLDRETSGCLLIAKKRSALRAFQALLRDHQQVEKHYLALVKGQWRLPKQGLQVEIRLRKNQLSSGERLVKVDEAGKLARSRFFSRGNYCDQSLIEIQLDTGRTHQIRVQCQQQGHPLAMDEKYGDSDFNRSQRQLGLKRLFLHASRLRFTLPNEQTYDFTAPLAADLTDFLTRLEQTP
ncbi:RluA family pseudouridine synthase [Ectothiorhodospiraceae bacterium BW-2]|nr:RluA family pseudouridine synthase [Ectothiorhodospiraceae bacterium BW-2]